MPLGNKNSKSSIGLKPVVKKGARHEFLVSRNIDGAWQNNLSEGVNSVLGDITGLERGTYEYEGDEKKKCTLFLNDGEDTFRLQLSFGVSTSGLLNSLLGLESFDNVEVSIYTRKDTEYCSFALRQNGEMVSWKYSLDEIPKPEEATLKGKVIRDYTEVDNFFYEKLGELEEKIKAQKGSVPNETGGDEEDDQVPF